MTEHGALGDVRIQSLLDLDPDLGRGVPRDDWPQARRATACHTLELEAGPADALHRISAQDDVAGFVVTGGLLLREVGLDGRALPELLGPGDVVGPLVELSSFLPVCVRTTALGPAQIAVLGPSFARACGHWPSLLAEVQRRESAARQRAAIHGAISQLPRVEIRIMALLWHLAGSWGRVGTDGVTIPFVLTHEMLGQFVGAERPTVTLAAGELSAQGLLTRQSDRTWLLNSGSDEWLRTEVGDCAQDPAVLGRARQVRFLSREDSRVETPD